MGPEGHDVRDVDGSKQAPGMMSYQKVTNTLLRGALSTILFTACRNAAVTTLK